MSSCKTKFQVGDRVAVYDCAATGTFKPRKGTVAELVDGGLEIKLDCGKYGDYPFQQCRRLKKKKPQYYWIRTDKQGRAVDMIYDLRESAESDAANADTFTEIVKLKVVKE